MDDSDLLAFTPVPVRARRDGWTASRQYSFILCLARVSSARRAAAMVGMSRQKAYALRDRPGAEGFAAAWRAAANMARRARARLRPAPACERAIDGELRPIRYRGRIMAYDLRYDDRALLRLLRAVDRHIESRGEGGDHFSLGR